MPRKIYKIFVRGRQRDDIDIALFIQALLAIAEQDAFAAGTDQSRRVAGSAAPGDPPSSKDISEE